MTAFVAVALTAVLGSTPEYSLVVTRRMGLDPAKTEALAAKLSSAIAARGSAKLGAFVPPAAFRERSKKAGAADPKTCGGDATCATRLGEKTGLSHIISVQLAALAGTTTVDAVVLEVPSGREVAVLTLAIKTAGELDGFAERLLASVPEPQAAEATPPPLPAPEVLAPPVIERAPPMPVRRAVALGLGAGALAAVGAAVALGLTAQAQAAALRSPSPSFLADQQRVRAFALGADLSWGLSAALAASALVIWFTTPAPPGGLSWRLIPAGPAIVLDVGL